MSAPSSIGAVSVLIVDDDEVSREVLATVFTVEGYAVRTARDGGEAVAMLDAEGYKPRVILMDLRMPGLNGANLISQLRSRVRVGRESAYESGARTAILAMSASEPRGEAAVGADGFLRKPFGTEELEQMLLRSEREAAQMEEDAAWAIRPGEKGLSGHSTDKGLSAGVPVLDRSKLEQLRALMPEASLRQIYTAATADLRRKMPDLDRAIERGDAKTVRHMGHAIKGGCGMVGAAEAAELGAILEAEGNELDNSRAIASQLRDAIDRLEDILVREFPLS